MLHNLNLLALEHQHNNLKLVLHKTVHNLVQVESRNYLLPTMSHTKGHDQPFLQPNSRIDAHLYSYHPSTIKLWNKLPSCAIESTTT